MAHLNFALNVDAWNAEWHTEKSTAQANDDLKLAEEAEIAAGQSSIDENNQLLASTDDTLAQSKEDREQRHFAALHPTRGAEVGC